MSDYWCRFHALCFCEGKLSSYVTQLQIMYIMFCYFLDINKYVLACETVTCHRLVMLLMVRCCMCTVRLVINILVRI
jgi:hypothetical protein